MTYTQQNAKLVTIGESNVLCFDLSLSKCIDKMFDITPIEKIKFYRVITADLTFYVTLFISNNNLKSMRINNIDAELIIEINKTDKYLYLNNEPIDLLYLPFILLILEKL